MRCWERAGQTPRQPKRRAKTLAGPGGALGTAGCPVSKLVLSGQVVVYRPVLAEPVVAHKVKHGRLLPPDAGGLAGCGAGWVLVDVLLRSRYACGMNCIQRSGWLMRG